MLDFSLSWINPSATEIHGQVDNPTWAVVRLQLEQLKRATGSATLYRRDSPQIGPQMLELISDASRYVLLLGELTESDYDIRSYDNDLRDEELVTLRGDAFPSSDILTNFQLVIDAFTQFYQEGDVSRQLLSSLKAKAISSATARRWLIGRDTSASRIFVAIRDNWAAAKAPQIVYFTTERWLALVSQPIPQRGTQQKSVSINRKPAVSSAF